MDLSDTEERLNPRKGGTQGRNFRTIEIIAKMQENGSGCREIEEPEFLHNKRPH